MEHHPVRRGVVFGHRVDGTPAKVCLSPFFITLVFICSAGGNMP